MNAKIHLVFFYCIISMGAVFFLMACGNTSDLQSTIESQNTQISELSTQVAKQEDTNNSQWGAISYLSTQMPIALDLITPVPAEVTVTPTPYLDIEYPPNTRTGIDDIDRVIDTFISSDTSKRTALVRFVTYPCTTKDGLGGPPKCQVGESDQTIVMGFPVLSSEGIFIRPANIDQTLNFSIRGLFAVYTVPDDAYQTDYWPVGQYAIVFTSEDSGHPHTVTVHTMNGEIVRLDFTTDWPPFEQIWTKSDKFILPPSTRPYPSP